MRWVWIICVSAVLLAGCQQPGGGTGIQSATAKGEERRFFEPEFDAVLDQVLVDLIRACTPSSADEDRLNACLRGHFAEAFDDSRQGRRECDYHSEVAKFMGCVAFGNTLLEIRHRLSDDSPVPSAFWREDEAMIEALTNTIVARGIDHCGLSNGGDQLESCVMSWFEQELDLPDTLARRCEDQSDEKDRYICFIEGVMVQYMQDHVARLGAINT
ncbi:hypothetical protein [Dongia sp.]|uniref:hypothetical protein n=1 Tax=Dongia sp. TaxID=1977262 RepID=UPI0037520061